MDKIKVILNPYAGRWLAERSRGAIEQALAALDIPFDLAVTSKPGAAIELARQASLGGFRIVVAAGGDGSVSEGVNGLSLIHISEPTRPY